MRIGSLFSGIGGFELGFTAAGAETVFVSEIDPGANAVLAHRFPTVPNVGDITEVDCHDLPEIDCLVGGFPCQDLSVAGRRAGLAGERSGLFHEFARVLEATGAPWFVLENVPGLLSSNGGRDMGIVVRTLEQLGYGLAWRVLDAQFLGVPQRRRRVFFVGHLGSRGRAGSVLLEREGGCWDPPARPAPRPVLAGTPGSGARADLPARGDVSTLQGAGGERGYRVDAEAAAGGHLLPVGHAYRTGHGQWGGGDGVAGTICERDYKDASQVVVEGAVSFHATQTPIHLEECSLPVGVEGGPPGVMTFSDLRVRRLTPRECERLQGFPDDWTLVPFRTLKNGNVKWASDSARYKQAGNAVAVPVVQWIAQRLVAAEQRSQAA